MAGTTMCRGTPAVSFLFFSFLFAILTMNYTIYHYYHTKWDFSGVTIKITIIVRIMVNSTIMDKIMGQTIRQTLEDLTIGERKLQNGENLFYM